MKNNFKHILISGLILGSLAVSCTPDRIDGDGNGLAPAANVDGGFTVTQTGPNHFVLKTKASNYIFSRWNVGGDGFYTGKNEETIFIPDEGTYKVEHQAIGQGGLVAGSSSETIVVKTSDPAAGNIIKGSKLATSEDIANWKLTFPNPSGSAKWDFSNGKATFTAGGWERNVIYQEVQVIEGKSYKADALVSSTTGVEDSWFEIYVGYTKPTANSDYSGDGNDSTWLRGINTWAGSGKSAFSGKISAVGSVNTNNPDGIFKATKTGTVYFAIRSGGNNMKGGISLTNVELRGIN